MYRDELRKLLTTLSPQVCLLRSSQPIHVAQERSAYILMERIHIPTRANLLVRDHVAHSCAAVSELGVYGVLIA